MYSFLEKQNFFTIITLVSENIILLLLLVVKKMSLLYAYKKAILGIFLDLSKVFDTIVHLIVFFKLNHFEVRGNELKWFNSYSTKRTK